MSSATLFRLSGIILLLGAVISLISGFMTLFFDSSLTAAPSVMQSSWWSTYWSLSFVALVLFLIGLPALYLRQQRQRGSLLGLIGVFAYVLGGFLSMATTGYFVSILPLEAQKASYLVGIGLFTTSMVFFGVGSTIVGALGSLLLGIAVMQARAFPKLVGILLIVSAVLGLVVFFLSSKGLLVTLLGLLSTVFTAIAFGWIGAILLQRQNVAQAAPSPREALR
jgi:hypothetical protein